MKVLFIEINYIKNKLAIFQAENIICRKKLMIKQITMITLTMMIKHVYSKAKYFLICQEMFAQAIVNYKLFLCLYF